MNAEQIKLYIHIGSPKTGSSAIQKFLNANRKRLASEQGILYPNLEHDSLVDGFSLNHASFFNKAHEEGDHQSCISKFDQVFQYCKENNIGKVIISNESWERKWWAKIMHEIVQHSGVENTIIVYVRRQDKFLEAAWKEWGHRWKNCKTIMDYKEKIPLDWEKILSKWTSFFPVGNFIVRPYERHETGENVVEDFCRLIDLADREQYNPSSEPMLNSNPGFTWEIMQMLSYSRKLLKNRNDKRLLLFMDEMLPDAYKKKPMEEYNFLSPKERLDIIHEFDGSNQSIARDFLGRAEGNLFNDPLPDPNEDWSSPEKLTVENLVPVFLEIMMQQREQIKHLQHQINVLNKSSKD